MTRNRSIDGRPWAVVVGMDDLRGVHAARTLARHGVRVVGVATDPESYGARSRACTRMIHADPFGQGIIDALVALGPTLPGKAIVFACSDGVVRMLAAYREQLDDWYELALPSNHAVDTLSDKILFAEYATERRLPIPETRILRSRRDAERAAAELGFPCALKPPSGRTSGWLEKTNRKAFKVEDESALLSLYDRYSPYSDALIVQRWIGGATDGHYTFNCYFDRDARPLVTFTSRTLRQWPPWTGDDSLSEEYRADGVVQEALRLLGDFDFHGLGEVEFKIDADSGEYLIVEPNVARVTGRCALAEANGVELLYTMYCDLAGLPLPEIREQRPRGVKWIFLRRDLMSAGLSWSRGDLTASDWFRSVRGPKAYALWSSSDPLPFLIDLWRSIRLSLSSDERRKRLSPDR